MKRWGWVVSVAVLLLAALALGAPARPAYAANCDDDQRVMGDSYNLPAGETLDRNLIVLGGNATIGAGATLNCQLVVVGGNADVAGTINGDLAVFGGNVVVRSTGVLNGELARIGGVISCEAGAVGCSGSESTGLDFGNRPGHFTENVFVNTIIGFYQGIVETFLTALVLGVLAVLVVVFLPEQTGRAAAAVTTAPVASGGLGLLTLVAVPVLLVLITITICLIPVALVGAVIFSAAILMGWIALGYIVGTRLTSYLNLRQISPAVAAGFGTGLLWLLSSAIGQVPCVGWVAWVILSSVGLGAVVLTRFGTQPYLPYNPPPMTPPRTAEPRPTEPPAAPPPPSDVPPALPPAEPPAPASGDAPDLSAL